MEGIIIFSLLGIIALLFFWRTWIVFRLQRNQTAILRHLDLLSKGIERIQQDIKPATTPTEEAPLHPEPTKLTRIPETATEPIPESAPEAPPEVTPTPAVPPPIPTYAPEPIPPSPTTRQKSTLETAALDILRKTWNWIVFGSEKRPEGVKIEFVIATTWLVRIGIVILVAGIGFFLRESFRRDLIPPTGRVSLGLITGIAVIMGGLRLLGRQYHLLGQGLIGGGLAMLYFSLFAAANIYHILPIVAVFALMAAVTLTAGILAIAVNSPLIAILGIIGGYTTPLMLSTGEANFIGLFSYLLLLGVGILGISHRKNWHLLNYLGLAGTYSLVQANLACHYTVADFWQVMPFLILFFLLYSSLNYLYNLLHARKTTLIELTGLVLNAAIFFHFSNRLITRAFSREWVVIITVSLAAIYITQALFFLKRRLVDRSLLLGLISLAGFFITITMPLLLSNQWLTVSWAIQAFLVLWVGTKLDSRFICHLSYLLYVIVIGRVWILDLGQQFRIPRQITFSQYWPSLLERLMIFGTPIASFAGACRLFKHAPAKISIAVTDNNDIADFIKQNSILKCFLGIILITGFLYLHMELNRMFLSLFTPLRHPALTCLWISLCILLGQIAWKNRHETMQTLFILTVGGLLLKFALFDLPSWKMSTHLYIYQGATYSFTHALMRLIDFGAILAFLSLTAAFLYKQDEQVRLAHTFASLAGVLLFIYLTLEINTFLGIFQPGFQKGGVSLAWALFAVTCLIHGIRKDALPLRLTGLTLFLVVSTKIFFKDLAHLDPLYRIIAFTLLGIIVLAGSAIYLRNRQKFTVNHT